MSINRKVVRPEIVFITSYPPRECGIATFSQDLIAVLKKNFGQSFSIKICALESDSEKHVYPEVVKYILNTSRAEEYSRLVNEINRDENIGMVVIQHEFGFYYRHEEDFLEFQEVMNKPCILSFHTVLPHPSESDKIYVQHMLSYCASVIVMTNNSSSILMNDYEVSPEKIEVIPHGTHLVHHDNKNHLKREYGLEGKRVLSTFGLLSAGKSIETTLDALPAIVKENPNVLFLILGKTHPGVVKHEGEAYREMLQQKVETLRLQDHVRFVNRYLSLADLLKYLQLTDIYLFTSKDPNQAVSGTFAYAMSCGCPIISTPIPHALEVLTQDTGIIVDFENSTQLSMEVNRLLSNDILRRRMSLNTLHYIVSTVWENSAFAHAQLFEKIGQGNLPLEYNLPEITLDYLKKQTTDFGILRYAKFNHPDRESGYTLDDNARALLVFCQHYELSSDEEDISYIKIYLNFISYCLQVNGNFYNYVDVDKKFSEQNKFKNGEDSKGRAIWALGYLVSKREVFPSVILKMAEAIIEKALGCISILHSYHAMAFTIKGLYFYDQYKKTVLNRSIIKVFANQLVQLHRHEPSNNSVLSEALLLAYLIIEDPAYKKTAIDSFSLSVLGTKLRPMEVAEKVLALDLFSRIFKDDYYFYRMRKVFSWFLGNNHLRQIVYNPKTGGCFDGLEQTHINLNQGAEASTSYWLARLTIEGQLLKYKTEKQLIGEDYTCKPVPVSEDQFKVARLSDRRLVIYESTYNKPLFLRK